MGAAGPRPRTALDDRVTLDLNESNSAASCKSTAAYPSMPTPPAPAELRGPHTSTFDVDEPASSSPRYLMDRLTCAERNGYAVFFTDSLSHFRMGKDGALEFVDGAKRRTRDQMEGWKAFRPHERETVDRFLASPCHAIVTMRVKTDYHEQTVDGRKQRVKIGLAPADGTVDGTADGTADGIADGTADGRPRKTGTMDGTADALSVTLCQ